MQEWLQQHQTQSKHLQHFQLTLRTSTDADSASEVSHIDGPDVSGDPTLTCTAPLTIDAVLGKVNCLPYHGYISHIKLLLLMSGSACYLSSS